MSTRRFDEKSGSIHVFGLGVRLVTQITLESNYLLQQMERVFHLEDGPEISDYLASIGSPEISLRYLYAEGKPREQAYKEISNAVVTEALTGKKCGYLTQGNPIFLNAVVFNLRTLAALHDLPFSIYPGVSSIDTILTDLFLAVEATGLQAFEATHFVRMQPRIDKRVPLILFQPAIVEAFDVRYTTGAYGPGVKILQDVLAEMYGASQEWILLRSAMSGDDSAMVSTGTVSELVEHAKHLELGTLIIPGDWKVETNLACAFET
jgi:siroheme synthase